MVIKANNVSARHAMPTGKALCSATALPVLRERERYGERKREKDRGSRAKRQDMGIMSYVSGPAGRGAPGSLCIPVID